MKQQQTDNTPDNKVGRHTLGEWRVEKYTGEANKGFETPIVSIENGRKICCIGFIWGDTREQSVANAELIASAPTLKAENEKLKEDNRLLVDALKSIVKEKKQPGMSQPYIDTMLDIAINTLNTVNSKP